MQMYKPRYIRGTEIITGNFDYVNVRGIDIVERLKWMNVIERRDHFVVLTVFKCIRGMTFLIALLCATMLLYGILEIQHQSTW